MRSTEEIDKILNEICDIIDDELRGVESFLPGRGMEYTSRKTTFCSKLREIYILTDNPEIRSRVIDATLMAKKMTKKLFDYRKERLTNKK